MFIKISSISILFLLFLVSGCLDDLTRADVIGSYHFNSETENQNLVIGGDGSYKLTITDGKKIAREYSNAWTFEVVGGVPSVVLKQCSSIKSEQPCGDKEQIGWRILPIERSWNGNISLSTDPDLNRNFVKE